MKKILAIILLIFLVVSLVACKQTSENVTQENVETTTQKKNTVWNLTQNNGTETVSAYFPADGTYNYLTPFDAIAFISFHREKLGYGSSHLRMDIGFLLADDSLFDFLSHGGNNSHFKFSYEVNGIPFEGIFANPDYGVATTHLVISLNEEHMNRIVDSLLVGKKVKCGVKQERSYLGYEFEFTIDGDGLSDIPFDWTYEITG